VPGAVGHCKIGLARENGNDVRRKELISRSQSLCEVRARERHRRERRGIGRGDLRRVTKIFRISLDDHLFVLRLLHEAKGAGSDGWREKSAPAFAGTMPMALGMRFTLNEANGWLR